jgi:hypothetical protein
MKLLPISGLLFASLIRRLAGDTFHNMKRFLAVTNLVLTALLGMPLGLAAGTTAFVYQGSLAEKNGGVVTGSFDFRFALYDSLANGNLLAGPVTNAAVAVSSGAFTATVDFGAGTFTGADCWLEIAISPPSSNAFTVMAPRQAVTPAPLALYAANAGSAATFAGTLASAQLTGAIPMALLPAGLLTNNASGVSLTGTFAGSGAGLTSLNVNNITGSFSGSYVAGIAGWIPTNSPVEEAGNSTMGGAGYYGMGGIQQMTNTFYLTNLVVNIAGNGSNVGIVVKEWLITNPTNASSFPWSTTAISTQSLVVPPYGGGSGSTANMQSLAVPNAPLISSGAWLLWVASPTNFSNYSLKAGCWYQDPGNTNSPRQSVWDVDSNTNVERTYSQPGYEVTSSTGFRAYGYNTVPITNLASYIGSLAANITAAGITNASLLPYATNTSDLALTPTNQTVQGAIDLLSYLTATSSIPFQASNTVVVIDGDSKAADGFQYLTNFPWWNSVAFLTNVAVGGSSLSDLTNRWATTTASFSSRLGNGTNGIYLVWDMHNDLSENPYSDIGTFSNHLARVASSNWNIIVCTVEPRASYGLDIPSAWYFCAVMNNWIRSTPLSWRVVDAERLLPNCYDTTFFADSTHLTPVGYSNVCWAVQREVMSPSRTTLPQSWVNDYGTNQVVTTPASTNTPGQIAAVFNASGWLLPTNNGALPPYALMPGAAYLANSNGTVYLLTSGPNSTTWSSTNHWP